MRFECVAADILISGVFQEQLNTMLIDNIKRISKIKKPETPSSSTNEQIVSVSEPTKRPASSGSEEFNFDGDDDGGDEIAENRDKSSIKRVQKFRPAWLESFNWLQQGRDCKNVPKPYCKYCQVFITNNRTLLVRHENSKRHGQIMLSLKNQPAINIQTDKFLIISKKPETPSSSKEVTNETETQSVSVRKPTKRPASSGSEEFNFDGDDDGGDEIAENRDKSSVKRVQKFRPAWLESFNWLQQRRDCKNVPKPYCKYCQVFISNNRTLLVRHENSKCHGQIMLRLKNQPAINIQTDKFLIISKKSENPSSSKEVTNETETQSGSVRKPTKRPAYSGSENCDRSSIKRVQKFRPAWLESFNWLQQRRDCKNVPKPYCKYCQVFISNNRTLLVRHENSKCHGQIMLRIKNQPAINIQTDKFPISKKPETSSFSKEVNNETETQSVSVRKPRKRQASIACEEFNFDGHDDDDGDEIAINCNRSSRKGVQKFRPAWLESFNWLQQRRDCKNVPKPYCKYCQVFLSNNITLLVRHKNSKCHGQILLRLKNQPAINI